MAENELDRSSATPWPIQLLDAPETRFANGYDDPLQSLLSPAVVGRNDPCDLLENVYTWSLHQLGDFQGLPNTPALNLVDSNGVENGPNSSQERATSELPKPKRFVCNYCSRRFRSQKDVDRHRTSVHHKSAPYLCSEQGCRRSRQGFTRKDNYETHLRHVHGKSPKNAQQLERSDGLVGQSKVSTEEGLEGLSTEKLAEMVMNEREKLRMEQQRREQLEEDLRNLRRRYEEREDMWLKFLVTKEGGK
ncbi:uncharacterized protein PAC_06723 [Phialocephala subalpina]|uniref:C2H2-type domain-containing protein n=1 Tax=Phialocephala subalpina TaxID=576137 RepID=A0A1L7WVN4_9HELO|nr:uncharacterized protein PAC_06723 [Phialocephala subalpina]